MKNIISRKSLNTKALLGKMKNLPLILASHAFLMMLIFILTSLLVGVLLFYNYVILAETQDASIIATGTQFNYNAYQAVLKTWETKKQNLDASTDLPYSNPFNP